MTTHNNCASGIVDLHRAMPWATAISELLAEHYNVPSSQCYGVVGGVTPTCSTSAPDLQML